MSGSTRGPWAVRGHSDDDESPQTFEHEVDGVLYPAFEIEGLDEAEPYHGEDIASVEARDWAQGLANARLIAAAPDLLEALKELVDCAPCQNGCAPDDMACATRKAEAAIAKAGGQA